MRRCLHGAASARSKLVRFEVLSSRSPIFQPGSARRLVGGLFLAQAGVFCLSNDWDPIARWCVRTHFQYSWQSVVVEGRWWTLLTANVHHADLDHLVSNCVQLGFGVCLLQGLLTGRDWTLLLLSTSLLSGLVSLCWTFRRYAPEEAREVVSRRCQSPPVSSGDAVDDAAREATSWQQLQCWRDSFSEFCFLRHTELLGGNPGLLTQGWPLTPQPRGVLDSSGASSAASPSASSCQVGTGTVAASAAGGRDCPLCGSSGALRKRVVADGAACGCCGAAQPAAAAWLACRSCSAGLCGRCVEALGVLGAGVAELVRLYRPYRVWHEESHRSSLGSSAVVQGVLAVAGAWSLHLLALGMRGLPLVAVPLCCSLQASYDSLELVRSLGCFSASWPLDALAPAAGAGAEEDGGDESAGVARSSSAAGRVADVSLSHLAGFAVGLAFYVLRVAPRATVGGAGLLRFPLGLA
eukprot:TRINITY_DN24073_c0_g1_i1.p1 TRINITY_DN24073_c0_g1~~TRINITY_DN24073_c0_g1_i1.p1  ORF type:complete len:466 (+),score=87.04 TRINITY_DN24073_c0_g1_i1:185-1582(+)